MFTPQQNAKIAQLVEAIESLVTAVTLPRTTDEYEREVREHRELLAEHVVRRLLGARHGVEAAVARDADLAVALLRGHIELTARNFIELLQAN